MRELKKHLVMRWDELLLVLALELGMFLFGEIMLAVIATQEQGLIELGFLMAIVGVLIVLIVTGMGTVAVCFNIGISMGSVRKRLVPMFLCVTYIEFLLASLLAVLLHRLERFLICNFYPGRKMEFEMEFPWNYILVAGLVVAALNLFLGTLFMKYGKMASLIVWILIVGCAGIIPRLAHSGIMDENSNTWLGQSLRGVAGFFSELTKNQILAGLSAVACIMILSSWIMLRKQQITM